jgi:hypothetical protein
LPKISLNEYSYSHIGGIFFYFIRICIKKTRDGDFLTQNEENGDFNKFDTKLFRNGQKLDSSLNKACDPDLDPMPDPYPFQPQIMLTIFFQKISVHYPKCMALTRKIKNADRYCSE